VKDDGYGHHADFAGALVFLTGNGCDNIVFELDGGTRFFFGGNVCELTISNPGFGVDDCAVVFLFLADNVVPFAGLTFYSLPDLRLGGFGICFTDLVECHADGNIFVGDKLVNKDLTLVERFKVCDKVFVFGAEQFGVDPADDTRVSGLALDPVNLVGHADQFDLGSFVENSQERAALLRGVDVGRFLNQQDDRLCDVILEVDDLRVAIQQ